MMNTRLRNALEEPDPELLAKEEAEAETLRQEMEAARQEYLSAEIPLPEPPEIEFDAREVERLANDMVERAKYIPLRLTYEERRSLRLATSAISVSEYTTLVDSPALTPSRRRHVQLQQICGFLTGIIASQDYAAGQEVLESRDFSAHESLLQDVIEILRRYKIMNPEKMRSAYGKLCYLIQDAISPEIQELLGVNIFKPVRTVYDLLEERNGLDLLRDPHIHIATQEILPDNRKSRTEIQMEIKRKERTVKALLRKYETRRLTEDAITTAFYSISDNNSFLNSNQLPIIKMMDILTTYFKMEQGGGGGGEEQEEKAETSQSSSKTKSLKKGFSSIFNRRREGEARWQEENMREEGEEDEREEKEEGEEGRFRVNRSMQDQDDDDDDDDDDEVEVTQDFVRSPSALSLQKEDSIASERSVEEGELSGMRQESHDDEDAENAHNHNNNNEDEEEDDSSQTRHYFAFSKQDLFRGRSFVSLAIAEGLDGSRLTHTHNMQFNYVYQSLFLWKEIIGNMYKLWSLSEMDLFSMRDARTATNASREPLNNAYRLQDTGQGHQRVQPCPQVNEELHKILYLAQGKTGHAWIGSSVIHLGDRNVPNALMFIDKYTQVSRILSPVVKCIEMLQTLARENDGVKRLIKSFGGLNVCVLTILRDFFRHAFDGSGADNFYDAGSCIDGRLTSAWNWCSNLAQKEYYSLFKLTGFSSFDGEFSD